MRTPKITLEQWASFKAVVDHGSFAMAAEALNKSQSSISYAVSRLNEQLPRPVLVLNGRKAVLTDDGKVLYRRATQLLAHAQDTEAVARQLAQGLESEVTIALDHLLDMRLIIPSLDRLAQTYPLTRVRILDTTLSGTEEALLEKKADIVVGPTVPVGHSGAPVRQIHMIPVAHPDHPLLSNKSHVSEPRPQDPERAATGISDWELKAHRQVVIRDTGQRRERDAGWLGSEQRWTVSQSSSSLKILRAGLAFAFLPLEEIEEDLRHGTLKQLPLASPQERIIQLYLMLSSPESAGPATRLLAKTLSECLKAPARR